MDFGLSEEQELLQETVRGFVANECPPARLREHFDAADGVDPALWQGMAEMGLAGLLVPEVHGGAGLKVLDLALVMEVLGSAALPGPLLGHSMASLAIMDGGDEAQKHGWLPRLAEGRAVASVALCEAGSAWEPDQWRCRASGETVSGSKLYVPHADRADLLVVGVEGGELVLVECGQGGVKIERVDGIDRTRPVCRVEFDRAPCQRLAPATWVARRVRDVGLALLAADSFGAATKLIDVSVEYAKTREQFGMKIGQFQAIKHQIARLGTAIEPTRALVWHAAYAIDHLPEESERAAALAKSHITDRAMHTARMAVELHGGLGFTWDCDVQMWFKRCMFNRTFLGTPEVLRERCAALAGW
ncbi:MAG: acyl-CoA/acyl-ACP dehydrogenase [Deltaproteobacteria bacterium]|nr:acyl-CoA/acyl-ACP dehydrogenase [Deltaproteobacteria bacterium]